MKKHEILKLLAPVGQCYYKDLAFAFGNSTNYPAQIKQLELDHLVAIRSIDKIKKKNAKESKTVVLTSKGRTFLADKFNDDYYLRIEDYVTARFARSDIKALNYQLENSRALLSFNQVGVHTFPQDKPALATLLNITPEIASSADKELWMYNNTISVDEVLNDGIYYSMSEVRSLVGSTYEGHDVDTLYQFRPRGIFINREKVCLVYMPESSSGKTMNITVTTETRGINTIKKYFSPIIGNKDIDALVLTNSNALVVDIAIAGKNGRHPRGTMANSNAKQLLDKNITFFDRVFVFPHTRNGMESLDYFTTHTFKEWQQDSYALFEALDGFNAIPIKEASSPELLGRDISLGLKQRAVFVPFIEIKYLESLHKDFDTPSILTYSDMSDTLSHIIRRENKFYDVDGTPLKVDHYKEDGYKVGQKSKPKTPKKRKTSFESVVVGLTSDEKKKIKRIAKVNSSSISAYIRDCFLKHLDDDYNECLVKINKEKEIRKEMRSHYRGGLSAKDRSVIIEEDDLLDFKDLEDADS